MELNSLKNKLNNLSDNTKKTQLESKLAGIENQIKNLSQLNTTLQKLAQEIKQIQQELGKEPDKPNPPIDPNQLQFTVYYFVGLGRNHMWIERDSDKSILIDKENSIFPNSELTKKRSYYTIAFLAQDAEKYDNQDHVYYFSKDNNKFTLKPEPAERPGTKTEVKFRLNGEAVNEKGEFTDYAFSNLPKDKVKVFYISKNHPRIKELLSEGKLQTGKHFIIRYGKVDKEYAKDFAYDFNEFNQDLEILETQN